MDTRLLIYVTIIKLLVDCIVHSIDYSQNISFACSFLFRKFHYYGQNSSNICCLADLVTIIFL